MPPKKMPMKPKDMPMHQEMHGNGAKKAKTGKPKRVTY